MTAAAYTLTPVKGGYSEGNKRIRYFDLTADTGTFTQATGIPLTAVQLGMARAVSFITVCGGGATTGTAKATFSPIGATFNTAGTTVTLWLYEGSTAGTALGLKTDTEAIEANFTVRLKVEGS